MAVCYYCAGLKNVLSGFGSVPCPKCNETGEISDEEAADHQAKLNKIRNAPTTSELLKTNSDSVKVTCKVTAWNWTPELKERFGESDSIHELTFAEIAAFICEDNFGRATFTSWTDGNLSLAFQNGYD